MTRKDAKTIYMELVKLFDYPLNARIEKDFLEVEGIMSGYRLRFKGELVNNEIVITEI